MSEPIYDETTERVYNRLPEHFRRVDTKFELKKFISGICSVQNEVTTLVNRLEYLPPDEGGVPGDTSDLVDPNKADEKWLPWLAQLLGVNLKNKVVDINARNEIIHANNGYKAGTSQAIISAVQTELVGNKSVRLKKRTTSTGAGGEWDLLIQTLQTETLQNILPSSVIVPSSVRSISVESVPSESTSRISFQIASNPNFYKSRALEFKAVPFGSGVGGEPGAGDGYGFDPFGEESFGSGDSTENEPSHYIFYTPYFFPLDSNDPLTTMVDAHYVSGTNGTVTLTGGIELYEYTGGNYVSLNTTVNSAVTVVDKDETVRLLGRSEGIPATATHGRFVIVLQNIGSNAVVHFAHFGARKEADNTWVPRSANPIQAVIDRGAKPAGMKLWHTYSTSSWTELENGETTTWNDLEAMPNWIAVEEFSE